MEAFLVGLFFSVQIALIILMNINHWQIWKFKEFQHYRYTNGFGWFRAIYTSDKEISKFKPELQYVLNKGRLIAKWLYLSNLIFIFIIMIYSEIRN